MEPTYLRAAECSRHQSRHLAALQSNDPEWVRVETFNPEALRRKAQSVGEFDDYAMKMYTLREAESWTKLTVNLVTPIPTSTRLDRLLASELRIYRSRLQKLSEEGFLLASVIYLNRIAGEDEDIAENQLSIRYGHIGIPYLSGTYAMDEKWSKLETAFGI